MKIGDVVLVLDGWSYLLGIAEVTTKHSYRPELASSRKGAFFDHVREVDWIKKYHLRIGQKFHPSKDLITLLPLLKKVASVGLDWQQ